MRDSGVYRVMHHWNVQWVPGGECRVERCELYRVSPVDIEVVCIICVVCVVCQVCVICMIYIICPVYIVCLLW